MGKRVARAETNGGNVESRKKDAAKPGVHDQSVARVAGLAVLASLGAFFYSLQRGEILMHGDAVAHINIARRVFDSLTPGPLQLGTVWLPLPHVLMIPFLWPDKLWQNGAGGSIPSMIAYVFGVVGIFRLVGGLLESDVRTRPLALLGAWMAAFAYGANPNLIYTQATALTESLSLALFIWATVYFLEFLRGVEKDPIAGDGCRYSLRQCAFCVACAELTRYDGWFLAGVMGAIALGVAARQWEDKLLRAMVAKFLLGIAVAPALWLTYNAAVYGNAFEFANGQYSAIAIQQRVQAPHPGLHNLWVAGLYFLKSAQTNLAVGDWGRLWLLAAVGASLILGWRLRRRSAAVVVVLWSPLAFYALSIAYGSVLVHVPSWWPFALFNERYGLELLPLFAASAGVLASMGASLGERQAWKVALPIALLIAASYAFVLKATPVCLQEAMRNGETRRGLETAVERAIRGLPPGSRFLMDLGEHVGVMERLGIPLRRVVNNENHRAWKRPTDPEGIWERALADPGHYVNYVIAFDGDATDQGVNRANLNLLMVIHSSSQPAARIYEVRRPVNQSR